MKINLVVLTLILLWSSTSFAGGVHYQLEVDGLACPFCAYGIEKKLSQLDGVELVETDVANGRVDVEMADGQTLNEDQARQAVKDAGFTLRSFKTQAERGKQ
jgi:mercuric ion binding protein